jgi:hypothetical protein
VPIEITPPPAGVYSFRVPYVLDGIAGAMLWRYTPTRDAWYLTLYSGPGELLVGPVAAAVGVDLLAQWRSLDVPPGTLVVEFDDGGPSPGRLDFGDRARLIYTSINEGA